MAEERVALANCLLTPRQHERSAVRDQKARRTPKICNREPPLIATRKRFNLCEPISPGSNAPAKSKQAFLVFRQEQRPRAVEFGPSIEVAIEKLLRIAFPARGADYAVGNALTVGQPLSFQISVLSHKTYSGHYRRYNTARPEAERLLAKAQRAGQCLERHMRFRPHFVCV